MRRVSCRVQEQEEREQKKIKLIREKQQEELTQFYCQLSTGVQNFSSSCNSYEEKEDLEDGQIVHFDIPFHMKQKYCKSSQENSSTSDEDDDAGIKPAYRKLKQNLYRPPIMRPNFVIEESPPCFCIDECDHNCQNRLLNMECIQSQCPVVASISRSRGDCSNNQNLHYCKNMCLQSKDFASTEVFSTSQCGYGLRILQPVPANSIIIEYLGEVLTSSECNDRMSEYTAGDDFYFASLGSGLFLDAKMMGSAARYANHSCDPNCELQKWTVMGESRIALVSKYDLQAGAEITYNYQYFADDFEGSAHMKRQICKCGAENCAGTIGGKVKPSLANTVRSKAEAILSGGTKRHSRQALEGLLESVRESVTDLEESRNLQERITGILHHASDWILQYESLVGRKGGGGLVDQATVRQLLHAAPTVIQLEQISALETLLRKAERVEKKLLDLSRNKCKSNEKSRGVSDAGIEPNEGIALAPIDEHGDLRLSWDEGLSLCKDILAALPIHCNYVGMLIYAYSDLNTWCRHWLLPIVPEAVQKQHSKPPALSSYSAVERVIAAYMQTIGGGQETEMVHINDVYMVSQCFEMRLNDFIVRRKLETLTANIQSGKKFIGSTSGSLEGPIESAVHPTTRFICERADVFPTAVSEALKLIDVDGLIPKEKAIAVKQNKRGKTQECEDLLYCVCRQTPSNFSRCDFETVNTSSLSTSSGKLLMMQCEVCEDWYHPICIQSMDALSTNSVTAKREREKFSHCPVCAYVTRNELTAFAYKSKVSMECVDKIPSGTANSSMGKKRSTESSCSDALRFMTDTSIKSVIEDEKTLRISQSPVSLLLNLCTTYIDEWKKRLTSLLSEPRVQAILSASLQVDVSVEDVVMEGRLLLESLKLQAEVKGLRVISIEDLNKLQEVIWSLSVRPVFRAVRIADNRYIRRCRPPLVKLKSIVSFGEGLVNLSRSHNASSFTATVLQGLKYLVTMAGDLKSAASRCISREQAMEIDVRLKYLCRYVAIENEFYYATVKCFLRPIKNLVPEREDNPLDATNSDASIAVAVVGDSIISTQQVESTYNSDVVPIVDETVASSDETPCYYCWCRGLDDGSPMICCDGCSEWFHIRCVGVGRKDPLLGGQQNAVFLCISCSIYRNSKYKFAW